MDIYHERGQGLIEYALILVFIAIVVLLAVGAFGEKVGGLFSQVVSEFSSF